MIFNSVTEIIGKTPLIYLGNIKKDLNLYGDIIVKAECVSPGGSIKDRVALKMIEDYEMFMNGVVRYATMARYSDKGDVFFSPVASTVLDEFFTDGQH